MHCCSRSRARQHHVHAACGVRMMHTTRCLKTTLQYSVISLKSNSIYSSLPQWQKLQNALGQIVLILQHVQQVKRLIVNRARRGVFRDKHITNHYLLFSCLHHPRQRTHVVLQPVEVHIRPMTNKILYALTTKHSVSAGHRDAILNAKRPFYTWHSATVFDDSQSGYPYYYKSPRNTCSEYGQAYLCIQADGAVFLEMGSLSTKYKPQSPPNLRAITAFCIGMECKLLGDINTITVSSTDYLISIAFTKV